MESPKRKLLVVDDNPGDIRMLEETLKQYGPGEFELLSENSLGSALERLSHEKVDAVLLDLFLPDAACVEGLWKIQETSPGTPLVVLTGWDDQKTSLHALQMGARFYLVKGHFRGEALVKALRDMRRNR